LASDTTVLQIDMPRLLWARLIGQLRRGGQGVRESGAFLLGHQSGSSAKLTRFICYDQLDAKAYQSGAIEFHGNGYAALWRICRESKVQLLADIHTHPGIDVRQSHIDQRHPMVAEVGHTALIAPRFAYTSRWSLRGVGVYEYLGSFQWRTYNELTMPPRVALSWW
jgi:proteasome lid subunit RPN8/RPN11